MPRYCPLCRDEFPDDEQVSAHLGGIHKREQPEVARLLGEYDLSELRTPPFAGAFHLHRDGASAD